MSKKTWYIIGAVVVALVLIWGYKTRGWFRSKSNSDSTTDADTSRRGGQGSRQVGGGCKWNNDGSALEDCNSNASGCSGTWSLNNRGSWVCNSPDGAALPRPRSTVQNNY